MCKRGKTFKFACVLFHVDQKAALVETKNLGNGVIEVGATLNAKWGDDWLSAEVLFLNSKYCFDMFIYLLIYVHAYSFILWTTALANVSYEINLRYSLVPV